MLLVSPVASGSSGRKGTIESMTRGMLTERDILLAAHE